MHYTTECISSGMLLKGRYGTINNFVQGRPRLFPSCFWQGFLSDMKWQEKNLSTACSSQICYISDCLTTSITHEIMRTNPFSVDFLYEHSSPFCIILSALFFFSGVNNLQDNDSIYKNKRWAEERSGPNKALYCLDFFFTATLRGKASIYT